MEPERKEAIRKLGDLKQAFAGVDHPNVTHAFDIAEEAFKKALEGTDPLTARDIILRIFRAVMGEGFLIMHRDEMHNALLASAQLGKIIKAIPEQPGRPPS